MLGAVGKIVVGLLKSYVVKLATQEFAHWALMQIAEAIVQSTETKEDDKWLAKIKKVVEGPAPRKSPKK